MRSTAPTLLSLTLILAGSAWCDAQAGVGADTLRQGPGAAAPVTDASDGGAGAVAASMSVPSATIPVADRIVVHKGERRLYLMRQGQVLRSYRIALGLAPDGPKERAGDFRTPEGRYLLTRRNPRSEYFLSIQVSYPNDEDLRRAHRAHLDPGGSIMLHGLPNTLRHPPEYYARTDWTDGCIAMSDSDMVELWMMTQDNTPIDILP
jgi:murein L,D-transpeptidase YafK